MSRSPSHPVRLFASVLATGALLTTAACAGGDSDTVAAEATASPAAEAARAVGKTPTPSPGTLTESGAKAALLTEADLEDDWQRVEDADKWRDTLLVGKVDVADFLTAKADAADCQKLLDGLYGDDLLGKPSGASALAGFEQGDSRLLEQVAAYDQATLDDAMKWLKSLPAECDQFTATGSPDGERTVQVTQTSVPKEGDARQGLHVTVQGTAADAPATLTLDVAVVRVGNDAITITAGGLDGGEADSVTQGVELGTQRLKDVLAGKTPTSNPGQFD
ncbi:lipoprotein [Streptomyces viridiviolaceus]|uniref:Lipoprotein n=1 Tax=Streptomyces viridiviolaceus TaxID=68282 RepID=A0ABW2DUU7_9ACTN|nr:hypothetical protein [Streptomyces viridiviolaceus]GHB31888.1 lipoprotein [Streptomyces viridiviolaceus]